MQRYFEEIGSILYQGRRRKSRGGLREMSSSPPSTYIETIVRSPIQRQDNRFDVCAFEPGDVIRNNLTLIVRGAL